MEGLEVSFFAFFGFESGIFFCVGSYFYEMSGFDEFVEIAAVLEDTDIAVVLFYAAGGECIVQ